MVITVSCFDSSNLVDSRALLIRANTLVSAQGKSVRVPIREKEQGEHARIEFTVSLLAEFACRELAPSWSVFNSFSHFSHKGPTMSWDCFGVDDPAR